MCGNNNWSAVARRAWNTGCGVLAVAALMDLYMLDSAWLLPLSTSPPSGPAYAWLCSLLGALGGVAGGVGVLLVTIGVAAACIYGTRSTPPQSASSAPVQEDGVLLALNLIVLLAAASFLGVWSLLWLLGAQAGAWSTVLLGGLLAGTGVAPYLGQRFSYALAREDELSLLSPLSSSAGCGAGVDVLTFEACVCGGTLAGSWLFCAPLPLDWGSRWQEWAYSPTVGMFHGYIAGAAYWCFWWCTQAKRRRD
jgi:hypothetical protein